jgi:Flp pilus assembly protein TadG
MPMFAWLNRFRRDQRGLTQVELAFILPIFLLILLIVVESARVYYQASVIERGLRAGVLFAARSEQPLSADALTKVENLVKRGATVSSEPYLVEGWEVAGADYALTTSNYDLSGTPVPVIRVVATVPFDALFPDLLTFFGLDQTMRIQLSHEQSYVDD